jgi:hypothetical protein
MLLAILTLVGAEAAFSPAAVAAPDRSVHLPVTQRFSHDRAGADDTFYYRLVALEADHPMPPGSSGTQYRFSIKGDAEVDLGPLNFDRDGLYQYDLEQVVDTPASDYRYDRRIYRIQVYAHARPDRPHQVVLRHSDSNGEKVSGIEFENAQVTLPPFQPTPDPSGSPSGSPTGSPSTDPSEEPSSGPSGSAGAGGPGGSGGPGGPGGSGVADRPGSSDAIPTDGPRAGTGGLAVAGPWPGWVVLGVAVASLGMVLVAGAWRSRRGLTRRYPKP